MALAPRITIEGTSGFAGTTTNVSTYTATEDATPVLLGSTEGGAGQLAFSVVASDTVAGDPLFAWVGASHASPSVARFADSHEVYNSFPNPVLGTNALGWEATGAVTSTRVAAGGPRDSAFFRATRTTLGTAAVRALGSTVIPGQAATASMYVRTSVAQRVTLGLSFLDSNNVSVGGSVSDAVNLPANTWVRIVVEGNTVPAGAATANIVATATGLSGETLDGTFAQLSPTAGFVLDVAGNFPPVRPQVATRDLVDAPVRLVDGSNGTVRVTVGDMDESDGLASISANSRLGVLLSTRTAKPMQGTPEQIFRYYLGLGGITTDIEFQGTGSTSTRAVQGWTGVIWDYIRDFAITVRAEVTLVSGLVVIRPLRQRVSVNRRDSQTSVHRAKGEMAQTVEVKYYNNRYATGLVYPNGGWNPDVQVYQVDAEEVFTTNIPVDVSPIELVQPTCVDYVARNTTDQSVYSVIGTDGLAIKSRQWTDNGGSVTVAIGEDNRSIDLTIIGANTLYAPYRIAVGAGASDAYSSLRIRGTGTFFTEESITIQTGLLPTDTPQVVGTTIENNFISSRAQAYDFGMHVAQSYAGYEHTLSVSTSGINRLDAAGSLLYPTFKQFNEGFSASGGIAPAWLGKTFADFDAVWGTKTLEQFNTYYRDLVAFDYGNQAFGNVSGSRVLHNDVYYRIDSASITESGVQYDATADTLFGDFSARWSDSYSREEMNLEYGPRRSAYNDQTTYTFADFNAMMVGKTYRNFNFAPLWRLEGKYRPVA